VRQVPASVLGKVAKNKNIENIVKDLNTKFMS
jgi:hypothetical protein